MLTTLPLVGGGYRGLKPPTLGPTEGPYWGNKRSSYSMYFI
ncbi:hypothetical protein RMAECT_0890 [Rickettsia rhipicephali str. Ect]|uniref:Uncharacterized protein n=1 Tax=Rickettsia rhipicephali str. Ect TaxID=1359199 RepID=A0A0F3PFB9_RICRH|nr:hypothetical protein RMAECT_0890 [Rickettsia rhipicephali str. Ect]